MDKKRKSDLVDQLTQLSVPDLIELFYEATATHRIENTEFDEIDDAYIVGIAGYSRSDGKCEVNYWALPSEGLDSYTREEKDQVVAQFGDCVKCGAYVASLSKDAICPICKTIVDCT